MEADVARQQLPPPVDELDDVKTHKACPDCYAEGRDPYIHPIATHFYVKRAKRYKGGVRVSTYCIEHEKKRAGARVIAKERAMLEEEARTGVTPPALAARRERQRKAGKTEHRKAQKRKAQKAYRATHKDEIKQRYEDWLAKPGNAERRKVSQAEWYQQIGKDRERERRGARTGMVGRNWRPRRKPASPTEEATTAP